MKPSGQKLLTTKNYFLPEAEGEIVSSVVVGSTPCVCLALWQMLNNAVCKNDLVYITGTLFLCSY